MSANLKTAYDLLPSVNEMERRRMIRIDNSFPVKVRGTKANGEQFELDTKLDDLSAGGLYMRIPQVIKEGAELLVLIQLSTAVPINGTRPPHVAAHGIVRRVERYIDGRCGVAIEFTNHEFL